jgi:hypothetical protein
MKVSIEVLDTDTNSKAFMSVIVQNSVSCFLAGYSRRHKTEKWLSAMNVSLVWHLIL